LQRHSIHAKKIIAMKKSILILSVILPFLSPAQPPSGLYKLVHFNDFSVDSMNMGEDIVAGYPLDNGNITGTCSYPIKKNVYAKNGMLNMAVINEFTPHPTNPKAEPRNFSGADWHEFVTFRYGYFETRAKLTNLDHIWSCFWLLKGGGIGRYQEIDIIECFTGSPKGRGYASSSQHWWQDQNANANKNRHKNVDFGNINLDSFHVFGCEWTAKTVKLFIDGELKGTMKNDDLHDPMYPKFDVKRQKTQKRRRRQISCGTDTTTSILMIDYLKIYQIPNEGSLYAKGEKDDYSSLINLKSTAKARKEFNFGQNMLHLAWYPQAKYTITEAPKNMKFEEVPWAMMSDGYNYRGELTKGFHYTSDVAGTYPVTIKITFPELSDFAEEVTFTVKIE
jgi:Glycosyl hydrolases family 16